MERGRMRKTEEVQRVMLDKLAVVVRFVIGDRRPEIFAIRNYDGSVDIREKGTGALIVVFSRDEWTEFLEANHSGSAGGNRRRSDQAGEQPKP